MQPQIKHYEFPQITKISWLEYLKGINSNPYDSFELLGPLLAKRLILELTQTLEFAQREQDKFQATVLLSEIEAQKAGTGAHATVIHNFPIDDITGIPTPNIYNEFGTNGKGFISEYSQLALINAIGMHPITDVNISGGNPFQHITPRKGKENDKGNGGSKEDFAVHVEKSFIQKPPVALSLLGIRNWTQTPTNLFILENVLRYLTNDEIETLEKPDFIFPAGDALSSSEKLEYEGPVLTTVQGVYQFRLKLDTILGKTIAAKNIIFKLSEIFNDPAKYIGIAANVVITPGILVTFDNRLLGHGRPKFTPIKDQERWLQRITAEKSLELAI